MSSTLSRISQGTRATWREDQVVKNPFKLDIPPMTITDLLLRLVLTVTLLPMRMLGLAIGIICVLWPAALVAIYGQNLKEPLTGIPRYMLLYFFAPAIRLLYLVCGVWIHVKGRSAAPVDAPVIVTAPHSSFFDPALVWVLCEAPSIVTKNDVLEIPFIGTIIALSQPVWIDRFNTNARKLVVEEIKTRARSNGRWCQLMLFPEGTTSDGRALITFKPGAFLPGVPVQPVVITLPDYMIWTWDSPGALYIMWRVCTSLWTTAEVEFLPVYVPNDREKEDANLYAENVRKFMAEESGRETSDLGFEDCRLIQAGRNLGLPTDVGTIDVVQTRKTLDISTEAIIQEFKHFAPEATKNQFGRITLTSFGDLIRVPLETPDGSGICAEAFMTFEKGKTGLMSFKEYLAFISLAKKINEDSSIVKIAELVGEDDEPYSYEELVAVTQVVAWRRHVDPSKIAATAEKHKEEVKAFKNGESDGVDFLHFLAVTGHH